MPKPTSITELDILNACKLQADSPYLTQGLHMTSNDVRDFFDDYGINNTYPVIGPTMLPVKK